MQSTKNKTTASELEISKFTKISDSWWSPRGPFALLHKINFPRLDFILKNSVRHFKLDRNTLKPLEGLRLLDVGCGGGLLCEPLARLGASVTGIDAAPENIISAKKHAANLDIVINYHSTLPEELAQKKQQFDIVLNMEVAEHTNDINLLFQSTAQLLKPGGAMFVSTLNRTLNSLMFAKFGAEYILRWLPIGTHEWEKFVKPSELTLYLKQNGIQVQAISGIRYKISEDSWVLDKDLRVNYIVFGTKKP